MPTGLFDLHNKTTLITGGSRGLGLALATGLAQQGCDVVLVARDQDRLTRAADKIKTETGRRVWTFTRDMQDTDNLEPFLAEVATETDGIDVLINCAGINLRAPSEEMPLATWNEVIQINLTAAFALSQAYCNQRRGAAQPGKIINIASLACHGARPTVAPYNASKAGLLMLTRTLGVEWAKYNINVNAIGPGYFQTEMTQPLADDPEFDRWVCARTPMARWGDPKDLVGAAIFLASAASDFVTGQIVYVDGGWTAAL